MKTVVTLFLFLTGIMTTKAQDSCRAAMRICMDSVYVMQTDTSTIAPSGPDYGCLAQNYSPQWFYLATAEDGAVNVTFTASNTATDINFVCWGPFTDTAFCDSLNRPPIACANSASSFETCFIAAANPGDHFVIMLSNYSNILAQYTIVATSDSNSTICPTVPTSIYTEPRKPVGIYPNPFTDRFTINLDDRFEETLLIRLYNIHGQKVLERSLRGPNLTIERENLKAGIYYYSVSNKEAEIKGRIVAE